MLPLSNEVSTMQWIEPRPRGWWVQFVTIPFKDLDLRASYKEDARRAAAEEKRALKSAAAG